MGDVLVERQTRESTLGGKSRLTSRRERFEQLAQPKQNHSVWATQEQPYEWGNQSLIRPLTQSAMNTSPSERLEQLATPKKNFDEFKCRDNFTYSCGRTSPIELVSKAAINAEASQRVEQLAQPRGFAQGFAEDRTTYILDCGRSSPIWCVSSAAQKADERERTNALAQPKSAPREYQAARSVLWRVPESALKGTGPDMSKLAQPKDREDGGDRHPTWVVSKAAMETASSTRTLELARPKKVPEAYKPERPRVETAVTKAALNAKSTQRLDELSQPNTKPLMDHILFNPVAFKVKQSALKGSIPARMNELSQPTIRTMPSAKKK